MTDIFCELLSIKEPQTTLLNKETTVQSYRKMSIQKHQEEPRHRSCTFNCTGEMGMDNFGCLNCSFALFLLFNETAKKKTMAYIRLQLKLPIPPIGSFSSFQAKMYFLCF